MSKNIEKKSNDEVRTDAEAGMLEILNHYSDGTQVLSAREVQKMTEDDVDFIKNEVRVAMRKVNLCINGINVYLKEAQRQMFEEDFNNLMAMVSSYPENFLEVISTADNPLITYDDSSNSYRMHCGDKQDDEDASHGKVDKTPEIPF